MGYSESNDRAISLKAEQTRKAQAILERMRMEESGVTDSSVTDSHEEYSQDEEFIVVEHKKASPPCSTPVSDVFNYAAHRPSTREIKPEPKHTIELTYDSGVEGITGGTNKFSVTVQAISVNKDDDNISAVLAYDVVLKPPAYTPLTVRINNGPEVQVLMGGTVKHGDDRFLFLLKIKN